MPLKPAHHVFDEAMGYMYAAALRAAVLLSVADQLTDGPHTPTELAENPSQGTMFAEGMAQMSTGEAGYVTTDYDFPATGVVVDVGGGVGGLLLAMLAARPGLRGNEPRMGEQLDLFMMLLLTGRERTRSELERLFDGAGPSLAWAIPTDGPFALVEAEAG
jgi:hypothetical protein